MKYLIFSFLIFIGFESYCQQNIDLDKLSYLVFEKLNKTRNTQGLMNFTWFDTLENLANRTNEILKKDSKLYHPNYDGDWDSNMKYWESVFVNKYESQIKKFEFSNFLKTRWRDYKNYSLFGEIICLVSPTQDLDKLSSDVVKAFLNSPRHKWWIFLPNSLIMNEEVSPFCSCKSTIREKDGVLILTCNMYMIQLGSKFKRIDFQ